MYVERGVTLIGKSAVRRMTVQAARRRVMVAGKEPGAETDLHVGALLRQDQNPRDSLTLPVRNSRLACLTLLL